MKARRTKSNELSPKASNETLGAGSSKIFSFSSATFNKSSCAFSTSDPYAIPTGITTRRTLSLNDQLITCPVINSLLGMISSFRSQLVTVVPRMRIFETIPVVSPTVIVSPIRMGRSKRIIKPETKFAKISCSPNPSPTVIAAINH